MTFKAEYLKFKHVTVRFAPGVPALLLVSVLLLLVGICAGEQTRLTPNFEGSEACCGLTQCSVLTIALLGAALLGVGTRLKPAVILTVLSAVRDPLSPPPELIAFRSA